MKEVGKEQPLSYRLASMSEKECRVGYTLIQFSFQTLMGNSLSLFYSMKDNSLPELLITEEEVDDQGVGIHCSKQPGPDGRSPRILKEISSIIYFYKDQFFNTPLRLRKLIYIYIILY